MFLDATIKRNRALIEAAIELHHRGKIGPNTYVLDVDRITANAVLLKEEADRLGLKLYMMTKQIGRNPHVAQRIAATGIEQAVAVDPWEALTLARAGIRLGNVGHLVQIPSSMITEILSYQPEVITVFSVEKAKEISLEAEKQGRVQDLLLRVVGEGDLIYPGQTGGFSLERLVVSAREIMALTGVRIAGVTVFPCFLYNNDSGAVEATSNAQTLIRGAQLLRDELGLELSQINAPSANSVASLAHVRELGGTHAEPGHAFTGTTPLNANGSQPETPALVYVSEVSHLYDGKAYTYGGGFYPRGHVQKAMVGTNWDGAVENILPAAPRSAENIDYYGELLLNGSPVKVGDTVVYAFRTQIFVTRSEVAVVEGISTGEPHLVGIYDSWGNLIRNG
ncbi:MAG: YhfX family PLP-dependent enzyme [Firmicutes bacterium]|jgi:predicted amino acid racemase|nr:YhfX family PLP-dependent enzyme [Bacillota bacterium]